MLTQLTQVTYETDHISLLQDLVISSAQNFCFLCITVILKNIKRNINSKKRNVYIGNHYYYNFGLPKIRVGRARTTENQVAFA